jgi:protein gp37
VINQKALDKLLKWKKPRQVFVQDMSDLLHTGIPFWMIDDVFSFFVRWQKRHTYLILTKYTQRMFEYFNSIETRNIEYLQKTRAWLGVSAENQKCFDKRWYYLKQIPAAQYWVSYEPALGPLILPPDFLRLGKRAWVVCGAETGPGARPMDLAWARDLRDQCKAAGVPYFFKSAGTRKPIPPDLMIRESIA